MSKSAVIHVRIDPETKARVEAAAAKDGRTVSDWISRSLVSLLSRTRVPKKGAA